MFWLRGMLGIAGSRWLGRGLDSLIENGPSPFTAAGYAYDTALSMCGNEGQVTIIEMMGYQAFLDAAFFALEGEDAVATLEGLASHPEAVTEILEEAGTIINDIMGELAEIAEAAEE